MIWYRLVYHTLPSYPFSPRSGHAVPFSISLKENFYSIKAFLFSKILFVQQHSLCRHKINLYLHQNGFRYLPRLVSFLSWRQCLVLKEDLVHDFVQGQTFKDLLSRYFYILSFFSLSEFVARTGYHGYSSRLSLKYYPESKYTIRSPTISYIIRIIHGIRFEMMCMAVINIM